MSDLTPEERLPIVRYLTEPHGRLDTSFRYAIYFVPSLLFGLYGMLKADFAAMAVGYVVLLWLVVYLISYQHRSGGLFQSALENLVKQSGGAIKAPPGPPD